MRERIQQDLKEAQLAKNEINVATLRMLLSEIHNNEIKKGGELEDKDIIQVVQHEVKKRKEAAEGFRSGGREEQAQKEEVELKVLASYLPVPLSDEELTEIVEHSINELGANQISDMGKVIRLVMSKAAGKVDGARVSALIKEKLS